MEGQGQGQCLHCEKTVSNLSLVLWEHAIMCLRPNTAPMAVADMLPCPVEFGGPRALTLLCACCTMRVARFHSVYGSNLEQMEMEQAEMEAQLRPEAEQQR